ncbi:MAG: VacJ family lipoprotein, partial [Myxococcota bacterium]
MGAIALLLLCGAETRGDPGVPTAKFDEAPAASRPIQDPDPLFDDDYDDGDENAAGQVPDPLEETNRNILGANRVMDRFLFDPITRAYGLAPRVLKQGVRNMFSNLDSPAVFTNDILQLEWKDASVTVARLLVNSTMGFAGFFDVATEMGLEKHDSDFGQTLALAGIPSGAYLMVPVLGPTTVRHGIGTVVDIAISPTV